MRFASVSIDSHRSIATDEASQNEQNGGYDEPDDNIPTGAEKIELEESPENKDRNCRHLLPAKVEFHRILI
jgi:hypothetical protein